MYPTKQLYVSVGSVRQWSKRPGFNPRSSHTKDFKKWYLIPPCLTFSIIRYVSRVKWSNPGKRVASPLHLDIVAIEKGAFWSTSTTSYISRDFRIHLVKNYPAAIGSRQVSLNNGINFYFHGMTNPTFSSPLCLCIYCNYLNIRRFIFPDFSALNLGCVLYTRTI